MAASEKLKYSVNEKCDRMFSYYETRIILFGLIGQKSF